MTNWMPGMIALGVGVAAGVVGLLVARKRDTGTDEQRDVLQLRADKLIEALRELQADKHHYDEATFAAEKARLERQAADALRERDQLKRPPPETRVAHPSPQRRHPQLIGMVYGAGFVALLWLLTAFIGAESTVKPATDERYEALLVLGAISISVGDHEKILQFWEAYMNQPPPRRRPPMLQKAYDWLEKAINE